MRTKKEKEEPTVEFKIINKNGRCVALVKALTRDVDDSLMKDLRV